jgi:hypothetical protein
MENLPNEFGLQPFDKILVELNLQNHDLVAASTEQITHKMIAKARKGRRITRHVQIKILNALNTVQDKHVFTLNEIFNYDGKS